MMKVGFFIKATAVLLALILCVGVAGFTVVNRQLVGMAPGESYCTDASDPMIDQEAPSSEMTQPFETEMPTETQPTETESAENMSTIGELHIITSGSLSKEYTHAQAWVEYPGMDLEQQTIRIKYRGNSSLSAEKKSYNIKFQECVSLFGMDAGKKWCLLADPFDKSLLRPTIGFEYAQTIGIPYTSQTRLCNLWVDGTYMGVYTAVEPVDMGEDLVDIQEDNGDFLIERNFNTARTEDGVSYFHTAGGMRFELNVPESPTSAQLQQITATVSTIEAALRSLDHTQYEKYVDLDSFVDLYIFHEVVKDIDFGRYSTRYYMKDGMLYAGPIWDLDLSMGNVSQTHWEAIYKRYHNTGGNGDGSGDSTRGFWCNSKDFYRWLCQDEFFMELVRERWNELKPVTLNLVYDNEWGENRIDWYLNQYGQALEENYLEAGWSVNVPESSYEYGTPADDHCGNVELLRQWLIKRIDWLDSQWAV